MSDYVASAIGGAIAALLVGAVAYAVAIVVHATPLAWAAAPVAILGALRGVALERRRRYGGE